MDPILLPLNDPQADLEMVGGKGMSLAKMINAGLPVPGGFHVTTHAYRQFVAENGLQEKILANLAGIDPTDTSRLEAASQAITRLFTAAPIPENIAAAVTTAYQALNERDAPVAVRSSATAEDLPGASFAGQQETYLNIRGAEAVLEAVRRCWASLWTARAIAYRMKNAIDQNSVALAVVVQELVSADAAGILFTANPVSGSRDELLINAAWGLGEAVVSGAVTPDTLTVEKETGRILKRETADKQVMTIRNPEGVREEPVPAPLRRKPVLSNDQAAELARLGARIEQFYGMPMDVEWALAGDRFAIVQARPITALPPEWKIPFKEAVYARGSLAEHTPSPVTPLFATLGLEMANIATAELWKRVNGGKDTDIFAAGGMYLAINGYVYGGMRMAFRDYGTIIKMSLSQIGPMFRGSVARWQAARKDLVAMVDEWETQPVDSLSTAELLAGARTVFLAACRYFTQIQTTLPAASSSEILFTRLYKSLVQRKDDPDAPVFLLGFESAALRAEKSLFDLAQWLKTWPALAEYVLNTSGEEQASDLKRAEPPHNVPAEAWEAWQQRFSAHLQAFGRTTYEFDFANPTPLEVPGPILDAVQGFLSGRARSPYERQQEAVERREAATRAALQRLRWPVKSWFTKLLRWAQETAPMREDAIFDMGMAHPLMRHMFAELGRRFATAGAISQAEDIYWLEKDEVTGLVNALETGQPLPDLTARVPERKERWQSYLKISPPVMLPERSRWNKLVHGDEAEQKDGKTILKGIGTSGGTVTAPACVLNGPEDFSKLRSGDVLVAVTTTPAWTPLFALASAVVTDIGGPLSHSSIVAREYGIPAVMAARGATRHITSGQTVTVDGSAGTVTVG